MPTDPTLILPDDGERDHPIVKTSVYQIIDQHIGLARAIKRIGRIVGAPGIGKTTALRAIRDADPEHVLLLRVSERYGNGPGILRTIAAALGYGWDPRDLFWVQRQLSGILFLFDEAQRANNHGLNMIRELYDYGLELRHPPTFVLVGNHEWMDNRGYRKAAAYRGQKALDSRTLTAQPIEGILPDDIAMVCRAYGMRDERCITFAQSITLGEGWLRNLQSLFDAARLLTRADSVATCTVDHLRRAAETLTLKVEDRAHA